MALKFRFVLRILAILLPLIGAGYELYVSNNMVTAMLFALATNQAMMMQKLVDIKEGM